MYYFPDAWYNSECTFPYNTDEPGVCAHRPVLSAIEEMTHMPHHNNSTRKGASPQDETEFHPQSHIAQLIERDGGLRCFYCGKPLHRDKTRYQEPDYVCIDHKLPRSKGGGHELSNLALSCRPCNSSKRTKTAEEFIALNSRREQWMFYMERLGVLDWSEVDQS